MTGARSLAKLAPSDRPGHARVALRDDGTVLRWGEFWSRVSAVAHALAAQPGRRIALDAPDAADFLTGLLGVLHAGKQVVIPANFQRASMAQCADTCDGVLDTAGIHRPPGIDGWTPGAPLSPDAAIELTTSGSSGAPKPIAKRLIQLDAEVLAHEAQWGALLGADPVFATVPHFHIYGLLFRLLGPLSAGRPFDTAVAATPHALLNRLRAHGRGTVISSPAHLSRLGELLDPAELAPHTVAMFSSGAPLQAVTAAELGAAMGQAPIEVYGSTETGGIAWRRQWPQAELPWQPLPGVGVAVDAAQALQVRSPFADEDTPMATGDLAEMLADGRFHLRGRADRIIKLEGKRVSLPAMEKQLAAHAWIAACAIIALPGHREQLGAIAELTPEGRRQLDTLGRRATIDALRAHLLEHFERVSLPRRWRFPACLPYNERGKLPLDALRSLFDEAAAP
ncbi:class I adenylate-forming enzyme family protein [Zoogloeaceae bacterium G21618-S1]|nr:class I adenylate-forming enzyme family protein [Zoogloeaceae bacterium G21618-S1]